MLWEIFYKGLLKQINTQNTDDVKVEYIVSNDIGDKQLHHKKSKESLSIEESENIFNNVS